MYKMIFCNEKNFNEYYDEILKEYENKSEKEIARVGVCEKISVSLIFYDKFLGWRMPQSFSGNHPALAAL